MLESESGGFNAALVVKDYVEGVLLAADAVLLAALALNLNVYKHAHLVVEGKFSGVVGIAVFGPLTALNEALEWRYPRVNGALDRVVEC